jgi:uncharacterized membrane protein YgcG
MLEWIKRLFRKPERPPVIVPHKRKVGKIPELAAPYTPRIRATDEDLVIMRRRMELGRKHRMKQIEDAETRKVKPYGEDLHENSPYIYNNIIDLSDGPKSGIHPGSDYILNGPYAYVPDPQGNPIPSTSTDSGSSSSGSSSSRDSGGSGTSSGGGVDP